MSDSIFDPEAGELNIIAILAAYVVKIAGIGARECVNPAIGDPNRAENEQSHTRKDIIAQYMCSS